MCVCRLAADDVCTIDCTQTHSKMASVSSAIASASMPQRPAAALSRSRPLWTAATLCAAAFAAVALLSSGQPVAAGPIYMANMQALGVAALPALAYDTFRLAVHEINNSTILGTDYIVPSALNLTGLGVNAAFFRALEAVSYKENITAVPRADFVIGPIYSRETTIAANVLTTFNIPQISPAAHAVALSDKTQYPFFARTLASNALEARALAYLCYTNNWKKVAVIATTDEFGASLVESFGQAARTYGITIATTQAFSSGTTRQDRLQAFAQLIKESGAWIIMIFLTSGDDAAFFTALRALDMHKPPYQLVYTTSIASLPPLGSVGLDIFVNYTSPTFTKFQQRVNKFAGLTRTITTYTQAMTYDATWLAGLTLAKINRIKTSCPTNTVPDVTALDGNPLPLDICQQYALAVSQDALGALTYRVMLNTTFREAVSGSLSLDANGDRSATRYWIMNYRNTTGTAANTRVGVLGMFEGPDETPALRYVDKVYYPDGTNTVPFDHFVPRVGDTIDSELKATNWVLAFGIVVLGSWTALILIEQAVWNYGHVPLRNTLAWCLASSTALTIGMWSSLAVGVTAPHFPAETGLPDTELSFTQMELFVTLLVVWPCAFVSFVLMVATLRPRTVARTDNSMLEGMSRIETAAEGESAIEKSGTQQMDADTAVATMKALAEAKARAAQERKHGRCLKYTRQAIPWFFASGTLMAGIVATHFIIFHTMEVAVKQHLDAGVLFGGIVIAFVFSGIGLAAFFHFRTSRYRWTSAFTMAIATDAAQWTFIGATKYTYTGETFDHHMTAEIIQIIAAVLTCIACFVFIGLNVVRLRLSKDVLDRFLIQAQKKIRALEVVAQHRDRMLKERDTIQQLVAGVRPLVRGNHPLLQQLLKEYGPGGRLDAEHAAAAEAQEVDPDGVDQDDTTAANTTASNPAHGLVMAKGDGMNSARNRSTTKSDHKEAGSTPGGAGSVRSVATTAGGSTPAASSAPVHTISSGTAANRTSALYRVPSADQPLSSAGGKSSVELSAAPLPGAVGGSGPDVVIDVTASGATSSGPSGPGTDDVVATGPAAPTPTITLTGAPMPMMMVRPLDNTTGASGSPKPPAFQTLASSGASAGVSGGVEGKSGASDGKAGGSGTPKQTVQGSPGAQAQQRRVQTSGAGAAVLGHASSPQHNPNANLPQPSKGITFADIMSNPVTLEIFKDAVAANHNSENVAFLLDVERYRLLSDDSDDPAPLMEKRRVLAMDIASTYLGTGSGTSAASLALGAPHAINIAATLRDAVLDDIRRGKLTPKLFDAPFHEVRRLLERNDYARFVESPAFAVCGALLVISARLSDRLALGAALPRGKAAEMLENSILNGGHKKSSGLFGSGSSDPERTATTATTTGSRNTPKALKQALQTK